MARDELDNLLSGAVANTKPDYFWRLPEKKTALLKIRILRDNGEAVGTGILPNLFIGKSQQPALPDMRAVRKKPRQQAG